MVFPAAEGHTNSIRCKLRQLFGQPFRKLHSVRGRSRLGEHQEWKHDSKETFHCGAGWLGSGALRLPHPAWGAAKKRCSHRISYPPCRNCLFQSRNPADCQPSYQGSRNELTRGERTARKRSRAGSDVSSSALLIPALGGSKIHHAFVDFGGCSKYLEAYSDP